MTYPQQPQQPVAKKHTALKIVGGILAGLVAICGIGGFVALATSGGDDKKPNPADLALAESPSPQAATQAPAKATSPTKAAPKKTGPVTISDEGILIVNREVKPGQYRATVPSDSVGCYWARLKDQNGTLHSILDNDTGEPKQKMLVTIKKTDKYFETHGCGVWVKIK